MATSVYSDFKVYDEQFQGAFIETLQQNVDAFNAASRGALSLSTRELLGHYEKEAFWDEVSAVSRRDISSTSSATATKLTQDEFIGVKLNRKNGPYETTLDGLRKIGRDSREFSRAIGVMTAKAMPQEILDRVLGALEGKLDDVSALEHDATDGVLQTGDLAKGLKLAGDSAGGIVLWVMHSAQYWDLVHDQVTQTATVFGSDAFGGQIYAGMPATLNRPVLVTDSVSLLESDQPSSGATTYSCLGLRAGAGVIDISEPPVAVLEGPLTGNENLYFRWQAEYAYNMKIRGCKWDTANGGVNPTNANVATASNWDTVVASNKLLPGVIIKSKHDE